MRMRPTTVLAVTIASFLTASTVFARDLNRPVPVKPEFSRPGDVHIWDSTLTSNTSFAALPDSVMYGGSLASGDLDGDGQAEIVVGAGPGAEPYVNIFKQDGTKIGAFLVDVNTNLTGVRVAVGDLNGDGKGEIIISFGPGAKPTVKTYTATGELLNHADVYDAKFAGGVHLVVADVDRDGKADIVVSPGPGGGPHIRVFDGNLVSKNLDFFAFDNLMRDGTSIAAIRTADGVRIVAAPESWSYPLVRQFVIFPQPSLVKAFFAFDPFGKNGLTLSSVDLDHDGIDEIAAARNGEEWPEVSIYDLFGTKITSALVLDNAYRGGIAMAPLASDRSRLMTMPAAAVIVGPTTTEQFIFVNLAEQRLYAYEHGRLARTFLVSTGIRKYPTPVMTTKVLAKIPIKRYAHSYGPGNPDNYDLPNVKYNLQIYGPYFIHYAYWHNNFGHPMSHGCVNTGLKDAAWIYDWTKIGTPVETR